MNNFSTPFFRFNPMSNDVNQDFLSIHSDMESFMPFYFTFAQVALNLSKIVFPDEYKQLDSDFNEKLLFYRGRSAIIEDGETGYRITDFNTVDGAYNMFNEPTAIQPVDNFRRGQKTFPIKRKGEFVIIESNAFWYPVNYTVYSFTRQIAKIYESASHNISQQKFPIILQGTKEQKLTMQNLIGKIEKDYDYIFLDKDFNINDITKLLIDAKFITKELLDTADRYKSQLFELLGVQNVGVIKQSGIGEEEIESNNILTNIIGGSVIDKKKEACDKIYNTFGIECFVEVNENLRGQPFSESGDFTE